MILFHFLFLLCTYALLCISLLLLEHGVPVLSFLVLPISPLLGLPSSTLEGLCLHIGHFGQRWRFCGKDLAYGDSAGYMGSKAALWITLHRWSCVLCFPWDTDNMVIPPQLLLAVVLILSMHFSSMLLSCCKTINPFRLCSIPIPHVPGVHDIMHHVRVMC